MKYAILIDGGFVRRRLGAPNKPATVQHIRDMVEAIKAHHCLTGHFLHRIIYYDARPLESPVRKPLQGGVIDFGKEPLAARSHAMFQELSREPYFALRMGELSSNGWGVRSGSLNKDVPEIRITAATLKPQISQKGVDMRIGMDIAALTLKNLVGIIVLVTGDSDFVPAMKFARREGAQLFLVPLGHGIREPMREHSDLMLDLP
ncbi:MAG TPA: NYN domain-containing protein [Burkholderiaceae bacterium]